MCVCIYGSAREQNECMQGQAGYGITKTALIVLTSIIYTSLCVRCNIYYITHPRYNILSWVHSLQPATRRDVIKHRPNLSARYADQWCHLEGKEAGVDDIICHLSLSLLNYIKSILGTGSPHFSFYCNLHISEDHHGHDDQEKCGESCTCLRECVRERQASRTYPNLRK